MAMSRERKIFVGVFVTAVLALAVDRLVLQGPATGPARSPAAAPPAPTDLVEPADRPTAGPASSVPAVQAERRVAKRLGQVARRLPPATEGERDIFQPSSLWGGAEKPERQPQKTRGKELAKAFNEAHTLTGVLAGPDGGRLAMINDRFVAVGHDVDGFRVVSIGAGWVILRSPEDDQRIVLTMRDGL
jgi:hypothetical protein